MRLLLSILFFYGTTGMCHASIYMTLNSSAVHQLAAQMRSLQAEGKQLPTDWNEMEAVFGCSVDERNPYVQPTLRYAFLTNEVRFEDTRILLIMRSPFRDLTRYTAWYGGTTKGLRELGRWAIVQDARQDIQIRYLLENDVLNAFSRARVSLPTPDGFGEWPHELRFRRGRQITATLTGAALALASVIFLRHRAQKKSALTVAQGKHHLGDEPLQCLVCHGAINPEDSSCQACGWSWK